jgi:hypothetical protein
MLQLVKLKMKLVHTLIAANKSLQLTNNTPLRSVLWSTEFKRYIVKNKNEYCWFYLY